MSKNSQKQNYTQFLEWKRTAKLPKIKKHEKTDYTFKKSG